MGEVRDISIFRRGRGRHPDRAGGCGVGHDHPGRLASGARHALRREQPSSRLATLDWPGAIDIARIQLLARPPRELGLGQLEDVIAAGGYGLRAREPYLTWLHQRLAGSFVPMFLMMLAFALVRRFSRTASIAPVFMAGIAGRVYAADLQRCRQRPGRGRPDPPRARRLGADGGAGADRARARHARRLDRARAAWHRQTCPRPSIDSRRP